MVGRTGRNPIPTLTVLFRLPREENRDGVSAIFGPRVLSLLAGQGQVGRPANWSVLMTRSADLGETARLKNYK